MASFDLLDCLGISYGNHTMVKDLFVRRRRERVEEGRNAFGGGRRERREGGRELIPPPRFSANQTLP